MFKFQNPTKPCKNRAYIYIYRERERERERERKQKKLDIILKCYSLSFPFKILPCEFFLMDGSIYFSKVDTWPSFKRET